MGDDGFDAWDWKQKQAGQQEMLGRMLRRDGGREGGRTMGRSSDMRRYAKVIGADVALATLAVVLFSPGLLGLSPTDPSILLSSVAVASGVALAGAAVATNVKLLAPAPKQHLLEVGSLGNDADKEPTLDEVQSILYGCQYLPTVGMFASDGLRQVEETERKRQRIVAMIDRKFPRGSLSWQRFASTLDSVISTVVRNCALIANQVQSFDDDGYQSNRMVVDSGDYRYDNVPDDIQLGRYKLYDDILTSMRGILNDNERLLLELDRFELELASLDSSNLSEDSEAMLDELKKAVSEMQYYVR